MSAAVGSMAAMTWTDFLEPYFPNMRNFQQVIFVKILGKSDSLQSHDSLIRLTMSLGICYGSYTNIAVESISDQQFFK